MTFSLKKMFKKAAKVGVTAGLAVGGITTAQAPTLDSAENGLWAGLVSAVLTAVINFLSEYAKKKLPGK
jgi:hypothetical protein